MGKNIKLDKFFKLLGVSLVPFGGKTKKENLKFQNTQTGFDFITEGGGSKVFSLKKKGFFLGFAFFLNQKINPSPKI